MLQDMDSEDLNGVSVHPCTEGLVVCVDYGANYVMMTLDEEQAVSLAAQIIVATQNCVVEAL